MFGSPQTFYATGSSLFWAIPRRGHFSIGSNAFPAPAFFLRAVRSFLCRARQLAAFCRPGMGPLLQLPRHDPVTIVAHTPLYLRTQAAHRFRLGVNGNDSCCITTFPADRSLSLPGLQRGRQLCDELPGMRFYRPPRVGRRIKPRRSSRRFQISLARRDCGRCLILVAGLSAAVMTPGSRLFPATVFARTPRLAPIIENGSLCSEPRRWFRARLLEISPVSSH